MGVMEGSSQERAGPHAASSMVRVDGLPATDTPLHGRLLSCRGIGELVLVYKRVTGLAGHTSRVRCGSACCGAWAACLLWHGSCGMLFPAALRLAALARCTSPLSHSSTHPHIVWPTASFWSAFADYHPQTRRRRCASCICGEPRGWAAMLAQMLPLSGIWGGPAC